MKIEILLSTYNGEKYLNELLSSILTQKTSCKISILARDDGSSDSTVAILNKWRDRLDINIIQGNNIGPRNSFEHLIKLADLDFDYFAFCDQDDVWLEDKLERAISKINDQKSVLYFSNVCLVDKDLKHLGANRDNKSPDFTIESVMTANPALGCTMVMDRELMRNLKQVNMDYYFMHDVAAITLAACIGCIKYDEKPSMLYRQHVESVTQGHNRLKNFRSKINFWLFQPRISISNQANEILTKFHDLIIDDHVSEVLMFVKSYHKKANRIKLATNKKFRVGSISANRSFILRVLLGVA
jgi:glycosyltransferase involved in cell wall biosynthesis